MNCYDIVFMGHLAVTNIVPFEGPICVDQGGPMLFGPMAASCLGKRLAVVTRIPKDEEELIVPLKTAGIDLYMQPGEISESRLIHPSVNADERESYLTKRAAGYFGIEDLPLPEPRLIHLGGIGSSGRAFTMEFMRTLKERVFRLSVDMQIFVWQVDEQTLFMQPKDIPNKREIMSMFDFVKIDVSEAKVLTGTDDIQEQAAMLESMGSAETLITSSYGALGCNKGEARFAKFTNKNILGRTGRGDTFFGAYLARRLDHSLEDSLRFAAALTSIKLESHGPFKGSLDDVLKRMNQEESPHCLEKK